MDIDIQELRGEALAVDLQALKSEIVADVVRQMREDKMLEERTSRDRILRTSALDRPQDLV